MTDALQAWEGILDPGEKILWQGKPATRVIFRSEDLFLSFLGMSFFGFAIFWMAMAFWISSGTGAINYAFPLFGVPFVLVGAYLMIGRHFWDAYRRSRTWYTLTDRRGFIATDLPTGRTLKEYPIRADAEITLVQRGEHYTVLFAERVWREHRKNEYRQPVGFELLPDGRAVYALLRDLREGMRATGRGGVA